MAAPYDNSADMLADASELVQQAYMNNYENEWPNWFGQVSNLLYSPNKERVGGDGVTLQFELGPSDSVRFTNSMLGAFANPDVFDPGTIKARFALSGTANDFVRVSASCQTNDVDLMNGKYGTIVDFAERMMAQIKPSYDESLAIHRNLARSARVALVNGTPTLNNGTAIDATAGVASSSTATNAGGARFKVDTGSIAYFRENRKIDIYSSAGVLRAGNVKVTDVNRVDLSIGVAFQTGSSMDSQTSTGNLASVADNDEIFFSGERNAGMYGPGAYFSVPTASESFLGGVDRTTAAYRFMNPNTINYSASPQPLTKSVMDTLALAAGWMSEKEQAVTIVTTPPLVQKLRNEYTEAAFLNIPDGDNRLKRFANFGAMGLNYQHPTWGLVKILSDVLLPEGNLRVLVPELWTALYYAFTGLRQMPGQGGGKSGWYRVTESTPNTGASMIWKCDWYAMHCDFCRAPWKQSQVLGLTT